MQLHSIGSHFQEGAETRTAVIQATGFVQTGLEDLYDEPKSKRSNASHHPAALSAESNMEGRHEGWKDTVVARDSEEPGRDCGKQCKRGGREEILESASLFSALEE